MRALVILAHPYENSFNHAIFNKLCGSLEDNGFKVLAHDLYKEEFNPVLPVEELGKAPTKDPLVIRHAEDLLAADILCFIHPNWWGQPPAILKGWIDRVIRPPYAYDLPEGAVSGLPIEKLGGKLGLVYNTSNTPKDREDNYFGDPLEKEWRQCFFGFCGIKDFRRRMFRIVSESTPDERQQWLLQVERDVLEISGILKNRKA